MESMNTKELEPKDEVIFNCLVDDEINRVKYLCGRYNWYKENKYQPTYPKSIQKKLDGGEDITEESISEAVKSEFDVSINDEEISQTKEEWHKIKNGFFESLKTLELPLQEKYFLSITKYGTGGSYGTPNRIQLNLNQTDRPSFTIAHEIVHLTIEHLIKKYQINHWTKERIVDLIMNKFFLDNKRLQRNPEYAEKISEIFEREFPNVENVVEEISKL